MKTGIMNLINFLVFITIGTFINCNKIKPERVGSEDKEQGATITIRNFQRVAFDNDGVLQWQLNAGETYYFAKLDRTILYKIDFEQFENKKSKAKLRADRGEIRKKEDKLLVWGNIYLKTSEGRILEADSAELDTETNILTSNGDVTVRGDGTVIRGKGLEADNNLNKYRILQPQAITTGGGNPLKR